MGHLVLTFPNWISSGKPKFYLPWNFIVGLGESRPSLAILDFPLVLSCKYDLFESYWKITMLLDFSSALFILIAFKSFVFILFFWERNFDFWHNSWYHQVHCQLFTCFANFLDVKVSSDTDGSISTDSHVKPTDIHQFFMSSSCHPGHVLSSNVYSQTLRIKRICSKDEWTRAHCRDLEDFFLSSWA